MTKEVLLIENRFSINGESAYIAIPPLNGVALEWRKPSQCVWDMDEFKQNGLELATKTSIRDTIRKHASTATAFFTEILELPNAGIDELLADLALMQKGQIDDPKRIYRLYERIQSHRRKEASKIKYLFQPQAR